MAAVVRVDFEQLLSEIIKGNEAVCNTRSAKKTATNRAHFKFQVFPQSTSEIGLGFVLAPTE